MSEEQRHVFEVASSKDIYVGRVVALRSDSVVMPGGGTAVREVIEHLGAVAVLALDADDQVTLIHQYRHPLGHRIWELPAGLLDVAGEEPVLAAQRELAEETGLAAASWVTLVDVAASPGFTDEVVRVFLARDLTDVGREIPDGDEETDLVSRKVPLAEAVRMALAGEIVNGASVSGILAAHAVLSGAAEARPAETPWQDRPTRFAAR
ncbi:NUDIX domain-containing protein [Kutzneria sp. CA-103260]|uniref:NUDIX domain-containing protein n=1 Tax=Kutzneria sp. CA-103260 TaxID=2802641 RepID=UPI001BAD6015|nr:NUDIX hydrolase [Kutzneria sp. CA-103260]QUQ62309.1 ADP-ribose pyrophosphatase [Kutzneria sp. CA-103260]